MIFIKDTSVVPQQGWQYYVAQTNTMITTRNFTQIYPLVLQHCAANNVVAPTEQEMLRQMCERLTIPCYEGESPIVNSFYMGLPTPYPTSCCGR